MEKHIIIEGIEYDAALIETAEKAVAKNSNGKISMEDAEILLEMIKNGEIYSNIEKATIAYIRENYRWVSDADVWLRTEVRKWAARK